MRMFYPHPITVLFIPVQTALAMCTVLSTTLTRVPNGVLRSKFVGSVQLLSAVVEKHRDQVCVCECAVQARTNIYYQVPERMRQCSLAVERHATPACTLTPQTPTHTHPHRCSVDCAAAAAVLRPPTLRPRPARVHCSAWARFWQQWSQAPGRQPPPASSCYCTL